MPSAQAFRYSSPDLSCKPFNTALPLFHLQKQHHTLVFIPWSSLTNTNTVLDHISKLILDHRIDLCTSETNARRIENSVRTAKENERFSDWIQEDEVAMGPDVFEARKVGGVVFTTCGVTVEEDGYVGKGLETVSSIFVSWLRL